MHYLRQNESIPIPKLYAYCTNGMFLDEHFIVLEHEIGVPLGQAWSNWSNMEKERCITSLATLVFKASRIQANCIGAPIWSPTGYLDVGALSRMIDHDARAQLQAHTTMLHAGIIPDTQSWLKMLLLEEQDLARLRWMGQPGSLAKGSPETAPFVTHSREVERMIPNIVKWFEPALPQYCLVPGPQTLTRQNIFVHADGPNAGEISAVLNWEATNILPMWMLGKKPSKTLGPEFAEWDFRFEADVLRLTSTQTGSLTLADFMAPQYDILRNLVDAIQSGSYKRIIQWFQPYKVQYVQAARTNSPAPAQPRIPSAGFNSQEGQDNPPQSRMPGSTQVQTRWIVPTTVSPRARTPGTGLQSPPVASTSARPPNPQGSASQTAPPRARTPGPAPHRAPTPSTSTALGLSNLRPRTAHGRRGGYETDAPPPTTKRSWFGRDNSRQ
ncbi:hypothetical protein CALVIDRAFT_567749 [Calocera viscosa TUFC12733]|uniref:Aminoglycoside phosphotransferase domain-containing protein n=1 Tax=Calocera viscosa (strain TUFC12733) TaxID=1330018 RepID=A0A167HV01_CALVF|nr:hypothetical protein CALVIDRAFT_567749 [Calocera viscosa TUFC12733]